MFKFIIVTIPFEDWKNIFLSNSKIKCIDEKDFDLDTGKYQTNEFKIMPICIYDYIKYNNHENNIFKNNLDNLHILNNKSKFGKYMLTYFIDNIPIIYYYNFGNETYISNIKISQKMILKPNEACGGSGIKIVNKINIHRKNCIISKYINHNEYYVGHFLVLNGIIHDKVYFYSNHVYKDGIKKGRILNYKIIKELDIDDSIFSNIFCNLNYSGFADSDFIINNGKIVIFEINPRPGGSLIHNEIYFNQFIDKLYDI